MAPVKNTTSIAKPTIPGELRTNRVLVLTGSGHKRLAWSLKAKGLKVTGGTQPKVEFDSTTGRPLYEKVSDPELSAHAWITWINEGLDTALRRAKLIINGVPLLDEFTEDITEQDRLTAKVLEELTGISVSMDSKSKLRGDVNILADLMILDVPSSKAKIFQAEDVLTTAIAKAQRELDKMWESGWRDYVGTSSKYNS